MAHRGWRSFGHQHTEANPYFATDRKRVATEDNRKRSARWFVVGTTIIIITITLLAHPALRIKHITVAGSTTVSNSVIIAAAEHALSGRRWGILPRANVFFLDAEAVTQAVNEVIVAKKLSLHPEWGGGLLLQIEEFPTVFLWKQRNQYYAINRNGTITEQIPNEKAHQSSAIVLEDVGRTLNVGQNIFTRAQLDWFIDLFNQVEHILHQQAKSVILSSTSPQIVQFVIQHATITVNTDEPAQPQILRLKVLVDSKPTLLTEPRTIDLRFGEKIYYQ